MHHLGDQQLQFGKFCTNLKGVKNNYRIEALVEFFVLQNELLEIDIVNGYWVATGWLWVLVARDNLSLFRHTLSPVQNLSEE